MSEKTAYKTPLTELLKGIPEDYRVSMPFQWTEGGLEIGHSLIPVGSLMHRAAAELTQATEETGVSDFNAGLLEKRLEKAEARVKELEEINKTLVANFGELKIKKAEAELTVAVDELTTEANKAERYRDALERISELGDIRSDECSHIAMQALIDTEGGKEEA